MPSTQMSCVAEANASTHSTPMTMLEVVGQLQRQRDQRRAAAAITNSMRQDEELLGLEHVEERRPERLRATTRCPTLAVASVISLSLWPRSLNIVPATQITIANGMPSATYAVGTQASGWMRLAAELSMPAHA